MRKPNASAVGNPRRISSHPFAGSERNGPVKVSISTASPESRMRSTSAKRTDPPGIVRHSAAALAPTYTA
jgi:hypothetical protein